MDLKAFFDEVNHDLLMVRVRRHVKDKAMLKLIRSWLKAGVMIGGLVRPAEKGTPQGGPLSPLLSNIMLDDLDKELEKRGHSFCRYADDCNIYVATQRSGERVLASITNYLDTSGLEYTLQHHGCLYLQGLFLDIFERKSVECEACVYAVFAGMECCEKANFLPNQW